MVGRIDRSVESASTSILAITPITIEVQDPSAPRGAHTLLTQMLGHIKAVTFSGGDVLQVDPGSTVVIVGPNNTGKSQALREIHSHLAFPSQILQVVTRVEIDKTATGSEVLAWLEARSSKSQVGTDTHLQRLGSSISVFAVEPSWNAGPPFTNLGQLLAQLFTPLSVQGLIANANLINPETESGNQALHFLFLDRDLEHRLSELCMEAFGTPVFLNRFGVPQLALHFGSLPTVPVTPPPYPRDFLRRISQIPLASNQGDGIKSFVGVALATMTTPFTFLLLDEPEAFLHPPQARLLGRVLRQRRHPDSQLFIATHDANLLRGLLTGEATNVAVWRMTRTDDANHCVQLSPDAIRKLWGDPLLRTSNILEGIFHRGVVIAEADADARFYEVALADANPPVPLSSDLFYTFAGGKQRIPMVGRALRAVGVTVAIVSDFDVLREEEPLRSMVECLGSSWDEISTLWHEVKAGIDSDTRTPSRATVREGVIRLIDSSNAPRLTPQEQDSYRALLHGETGWDKTKRSGLAGLPHGNLVTKSKELIELLAKIGLFVVPVGELEGWAPEIGGHGPIWLAAALQAGVHRDKTDLRAFAARLGQFALGLANHPAA